MPEKGASEHVDHRVNLNTAAAMERAESGATVLGAHRVRLQRHTDRPAPGEPRRCLNPRVAARDKWKRIELLQQLEGFLEKHRSALLRFWRGRRRSCSPAVPT